MRGILSVHEVCVVVVTYNPKLTEIQFNLSDLTNQNVQICLVDNSTDVTIANHLAALRSKRLHVISLGENVGIAKAQNLGIEWSFHNGFNAIVTMDQDSIITHSMIITLISTLHELSQEVKVACVGPVAYDKEKGETSSYNSASSFHEISKPYRVDTTLSSGMLISREVIEEVGLMDEKLFIDLVDWEWCWRAQSKGYQIYVTPLVTMPHKLGEDRKSIGFNLVIGVPAPIRHYYQFRNYFLMLPKKHVPIGFKLKYAIINLFKLLFYSLFIKPRKVRFIQSVRGIKDGLTMLIFQK